MRLNWIGDRQNLYRNIHIDSIPLVHRGGSGLLEAFPRNKELISTFTHTRMTSGNGYENDVLKCTLVVENPTNQPIDALLDFQTSAHPTPAIAGTRVRFPLNFNVFFNHGALKGLVADDPVKDTDVFIGAPGQEGRELVFHYLEPARVLSWEARTRAPILIPHIAWYQPGTDWQLALFASPERPWRISFQGKGNSSHFLQATTRALIAPGEKTEVSVWLQIFDGNLYSTWHTFHRMVHQDPYPRIPWLEKVRVHYYDYLSSSKEDVKRGSGYDEAMQFFQEFHVDMATQHGYYPVMGDYLQPARQQWTAMQNDYAGGVPMDIETVQRRIRQTQAMGVRAMIYLHCSACDSHAYGFDELRSGIRHDEANAPVSFTWYGPDVSGQLYSMSLARASWRRHLLQQAKYVMEILNPDGLVIDETFCGIGYDYHRHADASISPYSIPFFKDLRKLVRSYGDDKAVLSSDCGMFNSAMWLDGEAGDHAYIHTLGNELYLREPVIMKAVYDTKPWTACAWQYSGYWNQQMRLAKQSGAGVGLSNGWLDACGLPLLPEATRAKIKADIHSLFES